MVNKTYLSGYASPLTQQQIDKWSKKDYESEDQLQCDVILMISQQFPEFRDKVFHVENENYIPKNENETKEQYEKRCKIIGGKSKAKGKLAGVMDVLIVHNGILYKIELKIGKRCLNEAQERLHPIWNNDCPQIPVKVFYCVLDVYYYCCKILELNLKINFEINEQPR